MLGQGRRARNKSKSMLLASAGGPRSFSAQARRKRTISSQKSSSGAVFETWPLTFVHRRGGVDQVAENLGNIAIVGNRCTIIAPAVENAPPRKSSTTDGYLTVLTEEVRQLHTESPCV